MRTTTEIKTEMDLLTIPRATPCDEVIEVSGWYRNEDGTLTEWVWHNGRLAEGVTVRAWNDVLKYRELNLEGVEAWCHKKV